MADIATYGDLYFSVRQLIAQYETSTRPLEEYLRALWSVGSHRHREQPPLTSSEFFAVLAEAFTAAPESPGCEFWGAVSEHLYELELADTAGFQGWEYLVVRQIIDLREMAEGGQLANEYRYFGIDAPRGSRWYNFDPGTFLECAARYWVDRTDGPVSLVAISWEQFRAFLQAGQEYE